MARRTDQLVKMAHQIALNLGAGHVDAAASSRTAEHLRRFWTKAMRVELTEFWRAGGTVSPVVAGALEHLQEQDSDRRETE